jgi:hypothetical protein
MMSKNSSINYFRKLAKALLQSAEAQDENALHRWREVIHDTGPFALMKAQFVIAREHGFDSWNELKGAADIELRLAITMAREPYLNDFGIGLYFEHQRRPRAERKKILKEDRQQLRTSVNAVSATVNWLVEHVEPISSINRKHTSYGLKHIASEDIGYITNGVFIAAAIVASYPYKVFDDSPNVCFGMSEKSIRRLCTRRHSSN